MIVQIPKQDDAQAIAKTWGPLLRPPFAIETESEFDLDIDTPPFPTDQESDMSIKTPRKPAPKTLRSLGAVQLKRLEKLIVQFKKRERKLVYINGQVSADDKKEVWLNFLKRDNVRTAKIMRSAVKVAPESGKNYPKTLSADFAAMVGEHSVLDLFQTACKMLPGFEAASARRCRETIRAFVAKRPVAPIPYDGSEPALVFESPLFERYQILPSDFLNGLAIGSTGSGKTMSFVQPVLFSMLEYRLCGAKTASLLVIDPKVELLSGIEKKLSALGELERLAVVGKCDPINYFQEDDGLSVKDRFEKVKSFVSVTNATSSDDRWQAFAEGLVLTFLQDDQHFANISGLALLESVAAIVTGDAQYLMRNQWVALRKLLLLGMEEAQNLRHMCDVYDVLTVGVGMTRLDRPFSRYVAMKDSDQFFYNARGALTVADGLGSEEIEHILDLSVRRGLNKPNRTDVAALIDRGAVLVFQPRQSATDDLMGRALKSLYFRCIMERCDMQRPIAYFADEFQRFVTTDEETGEHTFLDRCRAYRVNTILATQSMAALSAATSRSVHGVSALSSILVNTPTKVCFRTTDESAVTTMKSFIPRPPGNEQHILTCRNPASLLTGEYYFALGPSWGRTRYQLAPSDASAYRPDHQFNREIAT